MARAAAQAHTRVRRRAPGRGRWARATACLALLVLLACLPPALADGADWHYRVRPGDTVWDLARAYLRDDVPWQRLQERNDIADPQRLTPGTRMAFPVDWLRVRPAKARVVAVEGEASASVRGDFSDARPVAADMLLDAGAALRTAAGASLTLGFADGSQLQLQGDSELHLDRLRAYGRTGMVDTRLRLPRGRATSHAARSRGPASRFIVETPGLMSSVRGTAFRMATNDDGRSRSEVVEGRVDVSGGGRQVLVAAGRGTIGDGGGAPIVPVPLLAAPDLARWPERLDRLSTPLSWPPLDAAHGYRLQLSAHEDFRTLLQESVVEQPQATLRAGVEGRVFARVRAIDGHGLEGLDAMRAIEIAAQPAPPFVVAPVDGGSAAGPRPRFRWTASADAASYRVQVARTADFAEPLLSETGLRGSAHRAPVDLPDGEYFWRVGATDARGRDGPYGDAVRFTLRPADAGPELGADARDGALQVGWQASGEDGQRYRFQASRKADFTTIAVDREVEGNAITLPDLRSGTWHLRVQPLDDDGYAHPFGPTQTIKLGCLPCRLLAGAGGAALLLLAL